MYKRIAMSKVATGNNANTGVFDNAVSPAMYTTNAMVIKLAITNNNFILLFLFFLFFLFQRSNKVSSE